MKYITASTLLIIWMIVTLVLVVYPFGLLFVDEVSEGKWFNIGTRLVKVFET